MPNRSNGQILTEVFIVRMKNRLILDLNKFEHFQYLTVLT